METNFDNPEEEENNENEKKQEEEKKPEEKGQVMDNILSNEKNEKKEDKKDIIPYEDKILFNYTYAPRFPNRKLFEYNEEERKNIFTENELYNYTTYGIFYCEKNNTATGEQCLYGKLICPDCMKLTQKMHKLRPNYLINDAGRLCTLKRNKICCGGKFNGIFKKDGIDYNFYYKCGHSGQCNSCNRLNQVFEKYYDAELLKKLRNRDKKLLDGI